MILPDRRLLNSRSRRMIVHELHIIVQICMNDVYFSIILINEFYIIASSSVLNGDAGKPLLLYRLASVGSSAQA